MSWNHEAEDSSQQVRPIETRQNKRCPIGLEPPAKQLLKQSERQYQMQEKGEILDDRNEFRIDGPADPLEVPAEIESGNSQTCDQ
ncbi:MAG: hypothetical protein M5U30_18080 [Burkholderiaceae bacterium]|nr:hypothetical protein [Burkholderiaceae bacterium]